MNNYLPILVFFVIGVAFVVLSLGAAWALRPYTRKTGDKLSTYECGEVPVGQAWTQFRIGYYIYLLIFVVFDVEVLFIFPWAMSLLHFKNNPVAYPNMTTIALIDMFIFISILVVGLAYAWKKGVLKWE
jgi:NADH-quinone oxidoreductase subunit A